ncbi:MAG: hypothetical protein JNJ48_00665 [Phycisphaerae bacterium]|nr:hypothetical protein [Phycisphaerae bacterium]
MNHPTARRFAALALALAAGLGACGRDDPARSAIRTATERLGALTAEGGRIAPFPGDRRAGFQQVIDAVKSFTDAPSPGTASAANLLTSRGLAGIADLDAATAADHQRAALNMLAGLRAQLNIYSARSAAAAASASFDPAPQLKTLDDQIAVIDRAAAAKKTEKATAERQHADLIKAAADLAAQAKQLREQANALRRQAADVSATRGLELTEQSAKLSRQADELDRQAAYKHADADQITPLVAGLQTEIDSLATQRSLTEARKREVATRGDLAKQDAAESRAAAAEAASAITRMVGEIAAFRSGDVAAAGGRAVTGYRNALAAAKKALKDADSDRSAAQLAVGSVLQSSADLAADQWRGHQAFAAVLTLLAGTTPALPDAAKLKADAAAANEAADAALKEAREFYTQAIDAYDAVKDRNETVQTRVERIKGILKNLGEGSYNAPIAAASPAGGDAAPTPAAGGAPAPAADPESAVRAMLDQYHEAMRKGDLAAAMQFIKAESPSGKSTLETMAAVGKSALDLDKACQAKFGKTLSAITASGPMGGGPVGAMADGLTADLKRTGADYDITISGNSGLASPRNPGPTETPNDLVLEGGKWLIFFPDAKSAIVAPMLPMIKPLGDVLASLARDVESGKIASEQAFNAQLMQRMAPIMMKMMQEQGMPQPGGG